MTQPIDFAPIAKRLAGGAASHEPATGFDRRGFLKLTALSGGGLAVTWTAPALASDAPPPAAAPKIADPSPFIQTHPDNTVEIRVNRLDFGQGALTALPMLVAEELDVDWSQVRTSLAPAGDAYKDPFFGIQMTGGSSAVPNSWVRHRQIGAATRTMLVAAAAAQWKVPADQCKTAAGKVTPSGPAGSKSATCASLAKAAAQQPVPDKVTLKASADYKIIGTARHRPAPPGAASTPWPRPRARRSTASTSGCRA